LSEITGFRCIDDAGFPVLCDPFGNNAAIRCPSCGGPVLVILRENQRGSTRQNPSNCPACDSRIWIEVKEDQELTIVRGK
jgi:DNA-directed RNA polymerase subunit RPC12/RpoP